mgnify:CR=1 FL=1
MGTLTNAQTLTQKAAIRTHLLENGWIDKPTAMALCDCDRLGARIWDIRHDADDPLNIRTERRTKKNRAGNTVVYAVYILSSEGETP